MATASSVTGVVDYFFDYQILPRTTDEIGTGGTSCAGFAHARDDRASAHGTSDGPGFHRRCVRVGRLVQQKELLDFAVADGGAQPGRVRVPLLGSNQCMNASVLDAAIVPGAKVTVIGKATEFNANDATAGTVTQIKSPTTTVKAAPTTTVTPVTGQMVSSLLVAATGEAYDDARRAEREGRYGRNGESPFVSDLTQYPGNMMAGVPVQVA